MRMETAPAPDMDTPRPKRTMCRRASDNRYLHKDFHGVLSGGMAYLEETYGLEAVHAFLRRFVDEYHAPLKAAIRARGLPPLREYLEEIFRIEEADFTIEATPGRLEIHLAANPAILHIRRRGYPMKPSFHETSDFLYKVLCEDTPLSFSTQRLDPATGERRMTFTEKGSAA